MSCPDCTNKSFIPLKSKFCNNCLSNKCRCGCGLYNASVENLSDGIYENGSVAIISIVKNNIEHKLFLTGTFNRFIKSHHPVFGELLDKYLLLL